ALRSIQSIVRLILTGGKPVVAAVDGAAFGAGLSLAAACDVVVASSSATFCSAFGKVGLLPDLGLLWSLPLRVKAGDARRIMLLCETLDAVRAREIGLVDELVPENVSVLTRAKEIAAQFARMAPGAMALVKGALAAGPAPLETVLELEALSQVILQATQDHK